MPPHILLTIDVEDWFQVENLKSAIPFESWPTRELRVERNTHKLLDLFDEIKLKKTVDSRQKTEARKEEAADRRQETVGETAIPTSCDNKQRTTDNGQQTAVGSLALTINQVNPVNPV